MEMISKAIVDGVMQERLEKLAEADAKLVARTIIETGTLTPNRRQRRVIAARDRRVRSRGKAPA